MTKTLNLTIEDEQVDGVFTNFQTCLRLFTLYAIQYADTGWNLGKEQQFAGGILNNSTYTTGMSPSINR